MSWVLSRSGSFKTSTRTPFIYKDLQSSSVDLPAQLQPHSGRFVPRISHTHVSICTPVPECSVDVHIQAASSFACLRTLNQRVQKVSGGSVSQTLCLFCMQSGDFHDVVHLPWAKGAVSVRFQPGPFSGIAAVHCKCLPLPQSYGLFLASKAALATSNVILHFMCRSFSPAQRPGLLKGMAKSGG